MADTDESVPTKGEAVNAALDVQWLIEACADGTFYQDYDESTALLGKARAGMATVCRFIQEAPHSGRRDSEGFPCPTCGHRLSAYDWCPSCLAHQPPLSASSTS